MQIQNIVCTKHTKKIISSPDKSRTKSQAMPVSDQQFCLSQWIRTEELKKGRKSSFSLWWSSVPHMSLCVFQDGWFWKPQTKLTATFGFFQELCFLYLSHTGMNLVWKLFGKFRGLPESQNLFFLIWLSVHRGTFPKHAVQSQLQRQPS